MHPQEHELPWFDGLRCGTESNKTMFRTNVGFYCKCNTGSWHSSGKNSCAKCDCDETKKIDFLGTGQNILDTLPSALDDNGGIGGLLSSGFGWFGSQGKTIQSQVALKSLKNLSKYFITINQINLDLPDLEKFPLFKEATVEHCILT